MTWSYILEYIWNDIDPYDQFIMLYCTNYSMYTCYDHVTWLIWMTYNEVLMIRYICYRWCCTINYQLINLNATHSSNWYNMSESIMETIYIVQSCNENPFNHLTIEIYLNRDHVDCRVNDEIYRWRVMLIYTINLW
jgi:hypothetical protein